MRFGPHFIIKCKNWITLGGQISDWVSVVIDRLVFCFLSARIFNLVGITVKQIFTARLMLCVEDEMNRAN